MNIRICSNTIQVLYFKPRARIYVQSNLQFFVLLIIHCVNILVLLLNQEIQSEGVEIRLMKLKLTYLVQSTKHRYNMHMDTLTLHTPSIWWTCAAWLVRNRSIIKCFSFVPWNKYLDLLKKCGLGILNYSLWITNKCAHCIITIELNDKW